MKKLYILFASLLVVLTILSIGCESTQAENDHQETSNPSTTSTSTSSIDDSTNIYFSWSSYPDADKYELFISEDPSFSITEFATSVDNTVYLLKDNLQASTFFYWRVRPVLSNGDRGPWVTGYFETDSHGDSNVERLAFPSISSTTSGISVSSSQEDKSEPTITVPDTVEQPTSLTQGIVNRVIDGDTIEVSISGMLYTVRYIGIDTPESVHPTIGEEPYGKEASEKNKALVLNQIVTLEKDVSETDRYGRLLRYVYVGDLFINAELVRLGYAQVATYPPDVKYQNLFVQLQQEAQAAGRGLWGIDEPEPSTTTNTPHSSGDVKITYIYYDGIVPYTESDEYVQITNQGSSAMDLTGWVLKDVSDGYPSFTFPSVLLQPGQYIRVYTNENHPEYGGFSFDSSNAVWSNSDPDTASLYDSSGNLISTLSY